MILFENGWMIFINSFNMKDIIFENLNFFVAISWASKASTRQIAGQSNFSLRHLKGLGLQLMNHLLYLSHALNHKERRLASVKAGVGDGEWNSSLLSSIGASLGILW